MSGFGEWLQNTTLQLIEVGALRKAATDLGDNWPRNSTQQTDYEASVRKGLPTAQQGEPIQALQALWPIYKQQTRGEEPQGGIWTMMISNIPTAAVVIATLFILYLFFRTFAGLSIIDLAKPDVARGLLTFIFGITTVGIAIIVTLAAFLGTGSKEELGERFQRGKDILTVLIGVFGAILGFYFGQQQGAPRAPQPQTQETGPAPVTQPPASR
jgi:hypothetical protein